MNRFLFTAPSAPNNGGTREIEGTAKPFRSPHYWGRRGPLLLFAAVLALPLAHARAQDDAIDADRPGFANGTGTIAPGREQLEIGYRFTRTGRENTRALGDAPLLRVGVAARTEIRVGLPSYDLEREPDGRADGFEDATLGFKTRLIEDARNHLAISLLGETTLPTGARAFREDNLQPHVQLLLRQGPDPLYLLASLGYTRAAENGHRFDQFAESIALGHDPRGNRLGAFLEIFVIQPGQRDGPNLQYVDGGLTRLLGNNTQIDVNGGIGLNHARPDAFVGAGIARRW